MKQVYLVGNKVMNDAQRDVITSFAEKNSISTLGFVPFDQEVIEIEMLGDTPLKHKEIKAVRAIDNICEALVTKSIDLDLHK
jgi:CO dehydrogenase nickel-insertion accessory protein CooC1